MKFAVRLRLCGDERCAIPKERNRLALSLIKNVLSNYDEDLYNTFYPELPGGQRGINEKKDFLRKDFTFGMHMGKCKFPKKHESEILLESDHFSLELSFFSDEEGYKVLVAFMNAKADSEKTFAYKDTKSKKTYEMKVDSIQMKEDLSFNSRKKVLFKIVSPVLVRADVTEENHEILKKELLKKGTAAAIARDTLHPFLGDKEGIEILKKRIQLDLNTNEDIKIVCHNPKKTIVPLYNGIVPCTLGYLEVEASKEILNYISKAGVGSKRSMGFGYLQGMGEM